MQGRLAETSDIALDALELARSQSKPFDEVDALFLAIHAYKHQGVQPPAALIAECLDSAHRSAQAVTLANGLYAAATAAYDHDDALAAARYDQYLDVTTQATVHSLLVGSSLAYRSLAVHRHDPRAALQGLTDSLSFYREALTPFGLRRLPREFVPAIAQLGHHDTVATIDGATAPLTLTPAAVDQAIAVARNALGPERYDEIHATAMTMSDDALEQVLADVLTKEAIVEPARGIGRI